MYSLVVSHLLEDTPTTALEIDRSRFLEYTSETISNQLESLSVEAIVAALWAHLLSEEISLEKNDVLSNPDVLRAMMQSVAARDGPIVSVHAFAPGEEALPIERLLIERVVSVNTAAAGGNASLMTIG